MATISSAGIGSGLDVKSLVAQLMAVERQPLAALQQTTQNVSNQLSAYGKLQAAMTTLRDSAQKLGTSTNWTNTTVATSNATAVTVSASGSTPPGSYSVAVSHLATAQTLTMGTSFAASTDPLGAGSLTIELGTWGTGQTSFTPKADAAPVTLSFANGSDSLEQVRDAINAAAAGVSASIINDASGARLSLRSAATGAPSAFRVTVNDNDGDNGDAAGLSQLAFDPSNGIAGLAQNLAAANATATINGVSVSSETNTLANVLDGLTLHLGQVTTANVDLSVDRDTTAIKKSITDFATAYNDMIKLLREQTRNDVGSTTNGALKGDSSAVGLINQLRTLAGGSSGAATAFSRLADIGLSPQSDGTLKVDETKLSAAMAKPDEIKAFFSRNDVGTDSDGFATLFKDFGDQRLDSEGVLSARSASLQKRIDRNNDRASSMEDRLALVEKRLNAQYSTLDTNMARLTSLQNYVTQQITNWNKSTA